MALHAFAGDTGAISPEAKAARKTVGEVVNFAEASEALFGRKSTALAQLSDMAAQHSQLGWDGADADPVDGAAAGRTRAFIRAIPDYLPLPEFSPEPDGEISLDWVADHGRSLSISIGPADRLAFAWLDGNDKGHGAVFFDGKQIPDRILQELDRIAQDAATFRAA
jgi:hypothetical protein